MLSKRILFGICVFCISKYTFAAIDSTNFTKFTFHGEYSGLMCPTDSILFTYYEIIEKCLLQCYRSTSCYGVFLQFEQLLCVGCSKPYFTTDGDEVRNLNGTFYFRRRTFLIVKEERDWEDSKRHCEDMGGYLADIKSEEEEKYILDQFRPDISDDVWIGATDSENESIFLWRDGSKVSDFYYRWADEEPDTGLDDNNDHCVVLAKRSMTVAWRDSYCGSYFASLCEFD